MRKIPRVEAVHRILDATDPDLSAFQKRGGKILMYHGWADPALNAFLGLKYYEQVQKQMGVSTTDFEAGEPDAAAVRVSAGGPINRKRQHG